jgi:hypothetical protein
MVTAKARATEAFHHPGHQEDQGNDDDQRQRELGDGSAGFP